MAEEPVRIEIEPGSLRRLVQASRTWDAVSRREMRAGLRAAAQPALEAAKADVLGPPPAKADQAGRVSRALGRHRINTRATRDRGLRAGLAAGASISIRTGRESGGMVKGEGVRVSATTKKLPEAEAPMLKAYMAKSFRHPVFGNPKAWANQHGKNWFYAPLRAGAPAYRAAVVAAIEKASEAIARD